LASNGGLTICPHLSAAIRLHADHPADKARPHLARGRHIISEEMRFVDFKVREYGVGTQIDEEDIQEVVTTLRTADTLAYGPVRDRFEREFANYCGAHHAISTTSATTALQLAVQLLNLHAGDEIIGTPQTFRATYIAVTARGVVIRFADIDPQTLNIDPATIESKITSKTKAIFVMHYGGNPVDLEPIQEICGKYNLFLVEDAAHAPGAEYQGRKIGSIGDITCFSFHSLKNMSTLGEGGMLTTNNSRFDENARKLRTMGLIGELKERAEPIGPYTAPPFPIRDHADISYTHDWVHIDEWGTNFRMSEVQAAIGSVQLKKLDRLNVRRAQVAQHYSDGLSQIEGIRIPFTSKSSRNVWHLYPVFLDRRIIRAGRDEFINYLEHVKGIQVILRYFPVHLSDYMRYYGHQYGECPVCERVWFEEQLNLPINPRMPVEEVDYVVESVREAVGRFRK
jgi:perosamine synthetase